VRDFHDIYIRIWDSGYSYQCLLRFTYFSKALSYFTMGDYIFVAAHYRCGFSLLFRNRSYSLLLPSVVVTCTIILD